MSGQLSLTNPHADQVVRREAYEQDHPGVTITEPQRGALWMAEEPGREILVRASLRHLLDSLEMR
jgi:hypothetical protein